MSERRTLEERVNELTEKENQIKAQLKKLKAQQSNEARKKRTRRLIEIGGVVESVLGKTIEKEDLPKLKAFLEQQEQRGKYFSKAMNESTENKEKTE